MDLIETAAAILGGDPITARAEVQAELRRREVAAALDAAIAEGRADEYRRVAALRAVPAGLSHAVNA